MADDSRWVDLGTFGADGVHGANAIGAGIERMVTGIASSPDSRRGVNARLNYLTKSAAGRQAIMDAGISRRALAAWTAGKRSPSPKNRARLDAAYWALRRERVASHLKQRLANGGRGTRIEIDPVDQSGVPLKHRRHLSIRSTTVRPRVWEAAVDAWLTGDLDAMTDVWEGVIQDLDSGYDAYTFVSSVGWAS
ncbi:transcriptional regulator [Streptomyces spiramenti]|uniref:Transcriptional regulator n=1 Tax=Streptomyces spiramenti TaxID=2720606 RepID=A0ABX1AM23_9ACTN|nr:transcriptional regulator [Streptomyces spiramenti]NJP65522.1 transcriptional regulator [Streptomyces spiramenti]